MQITAEINTDDIASEVAYAIMNDSSFDSHVNDLVEGLVSDQIAEAIERIDIDDIGDFERRAEEIARDVVADIVEEKIDTALADAADPQDTDDRVTNLEQQVEALTETVNRLTDALAAAALLLGAVVKG